MSCALLNHLFSTIKDCCIFCLIDSFSPFHFVFHFLSSAHYSHCLHIFCTRFPVSFGIHIFFLLCSMLLICKYQSINILTIDKTVLFFTLFLSYSCVVIFYFIDTELCYLCSSETSKISIFLF